MGEMTYAEEMRFLAMTNFTVANARPIVDVVYSEKEPELKKYYSEKEEKKPGIRLSDLDISGWDILKAVMGITASSCATVALHKYAKSVVPSDISTTEKVITSIGVYFVTGMVGQQVGKYARSEVDSLRAAVESANKAVQKAKEEREDGGDADVSRA